MARYSADLQSATCQHYFLETQAADTQKKKTQLRSHTANIREVKITKPVNRFLNYFITNWSTGNVTELNDAQIEGFRKEPGLDTEELAESISGLNCDQYADQVSELQRECKREELEYEKDDTYEACYWYYRLLSIKLTEEEAKANWIRDWDAAG